MAGIVPTLAKALRKLTPEQVVALLCDLTNGYEVNLNLDAGGSEAPAGSVILPRRMTAAMIQAARHHSWTEVSFEWKLQKMWDEIVAAHNGGEHGG